MGPLRIVIADDHPVVHGGIEKVLQAYGGFQIVGTASNGKEAIELCEKHFPDIILMDLSMPRINGIEATAHIKRECPATQVVVLSMHVDREYVFQVINYGASGYISKNEELESFPKILKSIAKGETYFSQEIAPVFVDLVKAQMQTSPASLLTKREREVLQLVVNGFTTKNIAEELKIEKSTVARHRNNIMRKLDIHDKITLIQYAKEHKLVTPHHSPKTLNALNIKKSTGSTLISELSL